jgi:hypothetical protein
MPTSLLRWLPAHADELRRLSARRRILWVACDREGHPLCRDGHHAELPSSLTVIDALTDHAAGPGVNAPGDVVRWQLWDHGRVGASG